jgi:hypothetical protein
MRHFIALAYSIHLGGARGRAGNTPLANFKHILKSPPNAEAEHWHNKAR